MIGEHDVEARRYAAPHPALVPRDLTERDHNSLPSWTTVVRLSSLLSRNFIRRELGCITLSRRPRWVITPMCVH